MQSLGLFQRVYQALLMLPKGRVTNYGTIAGIVACPRSARYVGFALHGNKFPVDIPCHRVVNRQGYLSGGFAFGGIDIQKQLLQAEGVEVSDEYKVDLSVYGLPQPVLEKMRQKFGILNAITYTLDGFSGQSGAAAHEGWRAVRCKVFVDEQGFDGGCEFDELDKISTHLTIFLDGRPIACARTYTEDGKTFFIGRIAVLKEFRGTGLGTAAITLLEEYAQKKGAEAFRINGQQRLDEYYKSLGYRPCGDVYDDEGVPHTPMCKTLGAYL